MMMPILPGAAIGVLGSGQLGRMFALAARRCGYRVHTFSPETDTPTGQVSDVEIVADYEDLDAVRAFAQDVAAVTFEFENVPAATADACAQIVPVHPDGNVLHISQNRLREKTFLAQSGIPCAPFRHITCHASLRDALDEIGYPAILKTAGFGYDGKGQLPIRVPDDADAAWSILGAQDCVLEAMIPFEREVSLVAARAQDGCFVHYGLIENAHVNGILDVSLCPARVSVVVEQKAEDITRTLMETLDVVGVLCVEFFVTPSGELLVNELAPRPHNSGHLTINAHAVSQFEQQLRAVCGLPLGSVQRVASAAAMANLLGDEWEHGTPDWPAAFALPGVSVHLYGKEEARHGRKMGHLTAIAETSSDAEQLVRDARRALTEHPR